MPASVSGTDDDVIPWGRKERSGHGDALLADRGRLPGGPGAAPGPQARRAPLPGLKGPVLLKSASYRPCSGQCCGDPSTAPKGPPASKQLFERNRDAGCDRAWRRLETRKDLPSAARGTIYLSAVVSAGAGFRMQSYRLRKLHLPFKVLHRKKDCFLLGLIPTPHRQRHWFFSFPFFFPGCSPMRSEVKLVLGGEKQLHSYPFC